LSAIAYLPVPRIRYSSTPQRGNVAVQIGQRT
jgi:hypothetical protein